MRRALNVTPVGLLKTVGLVSAPVMESKFALWEFGVSPMPEMRHQVIERGRMFDTPTFRWIPARQRIDVDYRAVLRPVERIPESLEGVMERQPRRAT